MASVEACRKPRLRSKPTKRCAGGVPFEAASVSEYAAPTVAVDLGTIEETV